MIMDIYHLPITKGNLQKVVTYKSSHCHVTFKIGLKHSQNRNPTDEELLFNFPLFSRPLSFELPSVLVFPCFNHINHWQAKLNNYWMSSL